MRPATLLCACLLAGRLAGWADPGPPPPAPSGTVTLTRAEFEALQAAVARLQEEVQQLKAQRAAPAASNVAPAPAVAPAAPASGAGPPADLPPPEGTPPMPAPSEGGPPTDLGPAPPTTPAHPAPPSAPSGRYLSLPDISLVVQAVGKVSTDTRDDQRSRLRLQEAEVGIQGFVYPDVKADCFITMSPAENQNANVEEAYLSYLGLGNATVQVGEKHVPFGRTNLLHNHSWLYVHQPLVLRNLVAEESLSGQGLNVSYVLPTPQNYFAQLDLGSWTGQGAQPYTNLPALMIGPGADFSDRFYTARLWTSGALNDSTELELGGSYANGSAPGLAMVGNGDARLTGLDVTFRHFGEGTARLLLRGEAVWRKEQIGGGSDTAKGYYLFGNWRSNKYASWGLLLDWSEFPQAPNLHESAASLIYTQQFSEQYYMRLEGTHGSRPGDAAYNELSLQWVWGVGPHTHNLE